MFRRYAQLKNDPKLSHFFIDSLSISNFRDRSTNQSKEKKNNIVIT